MVLQQPYVRHFDGRNLQTHQIRAIARQSQSRRVITYFTYPWQHQRHASPKQTHKSIKHNSFIPIHPYEHKRQVTPPPLLLNPAPPTLNVSKSYTHVCPTVEKAEALPERANNANPNFIFLNILYMYYYSMGTKCNQQKRR